MASVTSNTPATDDVPTLSPTLDDVMTTAIQAAISAGASKTAAATSAGVASAAQASVALSSSAATASATAANNSAIAAAASALASLDSQTAAAGSATAAAASQAAAAGSATAADGSAVAAAASAVLAASYAASIGAGVVASVNGKTGVSITLTSADIGSLAISSNLSDLANVATARVNLKIDQVTLKGDTNYTIAATDRAVATNATFTASRTWTLPLANSVNPGQYLFVEDAKGTLTSSLALTLATQGGDKINGQSTVIINTAFAGIILVSDGVSNWSFPVAGITTGGTGASDAATARTNLGLGTAATHNVGDFLQPSNNLSDVASAASARGSIGAAKSGANSDITSLASLSTPLSVAQGGTGSGSAPTAINGLTITATAATLSMTTGKTVSIKNSLTIQGTDATTFTFPANSSNVLTAGNSDTISVGFKFTPHAYATGNITVDGALGNYAYIANNGAFTITAPAADCAVDLLVTNGASAGAITFSGFTVGSFYGSLLDTVNGDKFIISIRRINGVSTYSIYALQ